jgi:hypothetical protein
VARDSVRRRRPELGGAWLHLEEDDGRGEWADGGPGAGKLGEMKKKKK